MKEMQKNEGKVVSAGEKPSGWAKPGGQGEKCNAKVSPQDIGGYNYFVAI